MELNATGIQDETGQYEDWLEIFNPGPEAVEMGGLFLTDNLSNSTQWSFPDTTLTAGGFLLVWCDNDPEEGSLHTNFRLSGNGEEIGLFGSYNYVAMHGDEMDDIRFMLNLDAGGGKWKKGIIFHGHPELEAFTEKAAAEMKAELPCFQRVSPYSDHWPFFLKGVPTGGGGDPETIRTRTGRGYGHTRYDTVDKVELTYLRQAAANYTRFLFRVANVDDWPAVRKTQKEIQDFIKEQGYDQTVVLAEKVKDYVRSWADIHPETQEWLDRKSDW